MAWGLRAQAAGAGTVRWQLLAASGEALRYADVVSRWSADAAFRTFWSSLLRERIPFHACCWECPPVTGATVSRPFECVFVESPALACLRAEAEAFADHFRAGEAVATFGNLGGDAVLVAPAPATGGADFTHLARFVATAAPAQADALWQAVGTAMTARIGAKPVWLSTAGLGVGWLHVRLDDRPKYYRHAPYAVT